MMSLTCQSLLTTHASQWKTAITHPFLDQCRAGTIKPQQFNTWLVQDYLFVAEFTRMQAQVIRKAPISHLDILLAGITTIKDELNWFRDKAKERQLNLQTSRQTSCEDYCALMAALESQPYAVHAVALWAIELAYNQGWQKPGPMPEPYTEFANRWGNSEFTDYVKRLADQADESLANAPMIVQQQAEATFLQIATLEQAFWQMAFSAA